MRIKNLSLVLIILFIFLSCDRFSQSGNYDMELTIELSVSDFVYALSGYNKTDEIRTVMKLAREKQEGSGRDFISLFGELFHELYPNERLAVYFSYVLRDQISYNSTNNDVIRVLRKEIEDAFDRNFNILRTRLDRCGIYGRSIDIVRHGNIIYLTLHRIVDPERIRALITTRGKLEFWETYQLPDIANDFLEAEELTKQQRAREDDTPVSTEIEQMTEEELEREYPLRMLLQLAVDQEGRPRNSATVGYVRIQDTSMINTMLKGAKEVFPVNLKLAWTIKPRQTDTDILELVALKITTRDKRAPLTGAVIVNARQDYDANGQVQVSLEMNPDGAKVWRRLTVENIGKQLAIVLDGYVYSYPYVNAEILNGRSSISGIGSVDMAKDLAIILKSGLYPCKMVILKEEVSLRE